MRDRLCVRMLWESCVRILRHFLSSDASSLSELVKCVINSYLKCSSGRDLSLWKQAWPDCRSLINTSYVRLSFKPNLLNCASKLVSSFYFFNKKRDVWKLLKCTKSLFKQYFYTDNNQIISLRTMVMRVEEEISNIQREMMLPRVSFPSFSCVVLHFWPRKFFCAS